jgi:hypothetical protein
MTPRLLRTILVAGCVATALVTGWVIMTVARQANAPSPYLHLSGTSVGYTTDYDYLIKTTVPGDPENRTTVVTVAHADGSDPGMDQPVDLYVDPTENLPPKLGDPALHGALPPEPHTPGRAQRILTMLGLGVGVLALLAAAIYLTMANTLLGRWNWSSEAPWHPEPGAILARWRPRNQWAVLFWASLGFLPLLTSALQRHLEGSIAPPALVTIAGGLLWVLFLSVYHLHVRSYRAWAAIDGLRHSSLMGWQEIPWKSIQRIEDRTVITLHYDVNAHYYSKVSGNQANWPRCYVRLLDGTGRYLLDLSRDLDGQRPLVEACAARTGQPVIERLMYLVDFSSWGTTSRKPPEGS